MVSTGSISSSVSSAAQTAVAGIKQQPPIERARATTQASATPTTGGTTANTSSSTASSSATSGTTPTASTPRGSLLDISI